MFLSANETVVVVVVVLLPPLSVMVMWVVAVKCGDGVGGGGGDSSIWMIVTWQNTDKDTLHICFNHVYSILFPLPLL